MVQLATFESVLLQFSFSNKKLVPVSAQQLPVETIDNMKQRVAAGNGNCLLEPVVQTDVSEIQKDLQSAGYMLVGGSTQERLKKKDGSPYWMVRFIFVPSDRAEVSDQFSVEDATAALDEITSMSFWRARGFDNPAENDGRMLSINLEARVQRYIGENIEQPVSARHRDEDGKPFGEPLPIQPQGILGFQDQSLILK